MKQHPIIRILITLILLAISVFVFLILANYTKATPIEVISSNQFIKEQVTHKIHDLHLKEKSFLAINPIKLNKYISENPLIESIKVRRYLLPQPHINIYINESRAWANYNETLIDKKGNAVFKLDELKASKKIYNYIQTLKQDMIQIQSKHLLTGEKISIIASLVGILNNSLHNIDPEDKVKAISIDHDKNATISSSNYQFKVGSVSKKAVERVKRIETVVENIRSIKDKVAYVDLSLSTSDIIIGKAN